jgi:aryl-alcohol dehydrogenase-like predicted oxidoreductase
MVAPYARRAAFYGKGSFEVEAWVEKRRLGKSGIATAPLAFGGNVFDWTIDEATSFALLDAFVAAGFDFIDTADVYSVWAPGHSGGESEAIIGKWLKSRGGRGKVTIATKVGAAMGAGRQGLSKAYIAKSVEDSLKRLQTDYIDLYQAHRDDAATPLEETLEAFTRLIEQGKVRAIGASNFTAARLAESLAVSDRTGFARYTSLQPLYNMIEREDFEAALAPLCLKEGIGVIPYYALASGFLTGKYRSEADLGKSARGGGVKKYLDKRGMRVLAALDTVAERLNAKPGQVAIAWLIAQPAVTAPIASATNLAQLEELVAATRRELNRAAIDALDTASKG